MIPNLLSPWHCKTLAINKTLRVISNNPKTIRSIKTLDHSQLRINLCYYQRGCFHWQLLLDETSKMLLINFTTTYGTTITDKVDYSLDNSKYTSINLEARVILPLTQLRDGEAA